MDFNLVGDVWAQVRDEAEMLLAPSLEVFTGDGTAEETFYVSLILIAGGLAVAILAVNVTFLLKNLTLELLLKIFGLWLIFSAGVSTLSLSVYMQSQQNLPIIDAEVTSAPKQVRVRFEADQLVVTWYTDQRTIGQLFYWTNADVNKTLLTSNHGEPNRYHEVEIPRPAGNVQMAISIVSDGWEYREGGRPMYINLNNE